MAKKIPSLEVHVGCFSLPHKVKKINTDQILIIYYSNYFNSHFYDMNINQVPITSLDLSIHSNLKEVLMSQWFRKFYSMMYGGKWHPEIQVRQVSLSKTWVRLCVQKDKSPVEGEAESSFIHQALGVR